jgi:hypothetical protein
MAKNMCSGLTGRKPCGRSIILWASTKPRNTPLMPSPPSSMTSWTGRRRTGRPKGSHARPNTPACFRNLFSIASRGRCRGSFPPRLRYGVDLLPSYVDSSSSVRYRNEFGNFARRSSERSFESPPRLGAGILSWNVFGSLIGNTTVGFRPSAWQVLDRLRSLGRNRRRLEGGDLCGSDTGISESAVSQTPGRGYRFAQHRPGCSSG